MWYNFFAVLNFYVVNYKKLVNLVKKFFYDSHLSLPRGHHKELAITALYLNRRQFRVADLGYPPINEQQYLICIVYIDVFKFTMLAIHYTYFRNRKIPGVIYYGIFFTCSM